MTDHELRSSVLIHRTIIIVLIALMAIMWLHFVYRVNLLVPDCDNEENLKSAQCV